MFAPDISSPIATPLGDGLRDTVRRESDACALPRVLFIVCGALAHEITYLIRVNGWADCRVQCLPAALHNRPDALPGAIEALIQRHRDNYARIFVGYGDCGTGGRIDALLERYGVSRIPGAHCYEFFAGSQRFKFLSEREPGTFYLTDFLARHFDRLVIKGLGIDRAPELCDMYFANYRELVYLAQRPTPELRTAAQRAATFLGLRYTFLDVGFGDFRQSIVQFVRGDGTCQNS